MTEPNGKFQPERYRNYLLILARARLRSWPRMRRKFDASDVVQDVLLKAHVALPQFMGDSEQKFTAWLHAILKNTLLDDFRKHRTAIDKEIEYSISESLHTWSERLLQIPANSTSPSQYMIRKERARDVADMVATLPPDQQTAVVLHYLLECPVPEIAREMNRTAASVAGLLRRALTSLRNQERA
jgi:RNA polymerase sigma-70 factor (ECF subfamily)